MSRKPGNLNKTIGITGGIGSGKSVVSDTLLAMGYDVYDCDQQAHKLMNESLDIKSQISSLFGNECLLPDGTVNRRHLSEIVFADADKLERLNQIVHGAVRDHLREWHSVRSDISFVETAILYQSNLDEMVDTVWEVTAPRDLRILRVMKRNGLTASQVEARIAAQDGYVSPRRHPKVSVIVNDGTTPVLPQVERLLHEVGSLAPQEVS